MHDLSLYIYVMSLKSSMVWQFVKIWQFILFIYLFIFILIHFYFEEIQMFDWFPCVRWTCEVSVLLSVTSAVTQESRHISQSHNRNNQGVTKIH